MAARARTFVQLGLFAPAPPTLGVKAKVAGGRHRLAKREPSEAQEWARKVFRTDYLGLPPGRHQAIGCGCLVVVDGKGSRLDLCRLHASGQGLPQFDLPPEWTQEAVWATRERQWYFSLPQAQLPIELARELSQLAIPWSQLDHRRVGKPESYPGIFTIDDSCGCRFRAVKITLPGEGRGAETRIRKGVYWYAVRVGSCGKEGSGCCVYSQYPLSPDLKKLVRQNRKR